MEGTATANRCHLPGFHCYALTWDSGGTLRTVQGGPDLTGQFLKMAAELGMKAPNTWQDEIEFRQYDAQESIINCLRNTATVINALHGPYHYLGPNSNSAIATALVYCQLPNSLPFYAPGRNTYLLQQ